METDDIMLAVYLAASGLEVQEIKPGFNGKFPKCTFMFKDVPQDMLNNWMHGKALVDVRQAVNAYRHLMRNSRFEMEKNGSKTKS